MQLRFLTYNQLKIRLKRRKEATNQSILIKQYMLWVWDPENCRRMSGCIWEIVPQEGPQFVTNPSCGVFLKLCSLTDGQTDGQFFNLWTATSGRLTFKMKNKTFEICMTTNIILTLKKENVTDNTCSLFIQVLYPVHKLMLVKRQLWVSKRQSFETHSFCLHSHMLPPSKLVNGLALYPDVYQLSSISVVPHLLIISPLS